MVLVPGFEPGSTDRESVMMDRTTLHEPCYGDLPSIFENDVTSDIQKFHFHFHPNLLRLHSYLDGQT